MEYNYKFLDIEFIEEDIIQIYLNRASLHNAFNDDLVSELTDIGKNLKHNSEIRIVILSGHGKSFCAGADLNWMKETKNYSYEDNLVDSKKLGEMFHILDNLPQAVVGRINGSAIGGGTGLVSICDVSVTVKNAKFGFSEVNLGLVPAVISPFVINKIGGKNAREFFLTGERFSSEIACKIGLVNYVVEDNTELDVKIKQLLNQIYASGPLALNESKKLIKIIQNHNEELLNTTSELIAKLRVSEEGQEGISSFLDKRKPIWNKSKKVL